MNRGGYPEPMHDQDYDENSDELTKADILKMIATLIIAVVMGIVFMNV